MRGAWQGAMLLGALGMLGCSTSSDSTSPRLNVVEPSNSISGAGDGRVKEQRVSGDPAIVLTTYNNALEFYRLNAVRHRDGSVSGEFDEFSQQDGGQWIHAKVFCFSIVGKTARLAARIERSNVAFGPSGSYVVWSVIDNDEGKRSRPDQTTDVYFGGTEAQARFHCDVGYPLAPYFSAIRGKIEVQ